VVKHLDVYDCLCVLLSRLLEGGRERESESESEREDPYADNDATIHFISFGKTEESQRIQSTQREIIREPKSTNQHGEGDK